MHEATFRANLTKKLLDTEQFDPKAIASYVNELICKKSECKFVLVKRTKRITIYDFSIRHGRDFYLFIRYNETISNNGVVTLTFSNEELCVINDYMQRTSAENKRFYFLLATRIVHSQEVYYITISAEEYIKFGDNEQNTLCFKVHKPQDRREAEKVCFSIICGGEEVQRIRSNRISKIIKETTYKESFCQTANRPTDIQRIYNTDIKKRHYYFGAALTMFFDKNIECKPSIVESLIETSLYLFTTNSSEFYLLMKHTENCKKLSKGSKKGSLCWTIKFTDTDRALIDKYRNKLNRNQQFYILVICSENDFFNTRFLLLHLEDYDKLSGQQSITFRLDKGNMNYKKSFSVCKKDGEELSVECNRVKKELIKRE